MSSSLDCAADTSLANSPGWRVGPAIVSELNIAIWLIGEGEKLKMARDLLAPLLDTVDDALLEEMPALFGSASPGLDTPLIDLAEFAGVLDEPDYARATLAMRELTIEQILAALGCSEEQLLSADRASLLAAGLAQRTQALFQAIGLESSNPAAVVRRREAKTARLMTLLPGGERYARFWHWLDRFYYESYRPWRLSRHAFMQAETARATAALGGTSGSGVPNLDWLPPQHPLHSRASVYQAISEGRFGVHFLVVPFSLVDLLEISQHWLYCTFAEPDELHAAFHRTAEDLAVRTKALADPTRLIILRLIRNFAMDNSEMARFLEITRPTVSVHAKILREAGLINTRQVGRQARHEIDSASVQRLFRDLAHFLDLPDDELDSATRD